MKTVEMLDAVKQRHSLTSDYKLAKLLKTSPQKISNWRAGRTLPGTLSCFAIAEALGEQPAGIIALVELERAENGEENADAEEWKGWVKKLSGAAASILLVMGLGGFSNADARLVNQADTQTIYTSYRSKKSRTRKAGFFDGLTPAMA